jgi:hypothetical protein
MGRPSQLTCGPARDPRVSDICRPSSLSRPRPGAASVIGLRHAWSFLRSPRYPRLVPDFSGSRRQSDSWVVHGAPEVVLGTLVKAAQKAGGRIDVESQAGREAEIVLGSRSRYRLLGMSSPVSTRPLRVHTSVSEHSPESTLIVVDAASDEGWYAFEVSFLTSRQFNKAFARLFAHLRSAAPPIGSASNTRSRVSR